MGMLPPEQTVDSFGTQLPPEMQLAVLRHLTAQEVAQLARVNKAWQHASEAEAVWLELRRRDFPSAQLTANVLDQRARRLLAGGSGSRTSACAMEQPAGGGSSSPAQPSAGKLVYRWLVAKQTCDRCKAQFADGANGQDACTFHPGVLFSGGLMNGASLRYTCCNRRAHHIPTGSRDQNGCKASYHCSAAGSSAWEPDLTGGVKPRLVLTRPCPAAAAPASAGDSCASSANCDCASAASSRASSPVESPGSPVEWHPDQRPTWGLIELPSRLLSSL